MRSEKKIAGGRAVYLGEARLCLPRDADSERHADHRRADLVEGAEGALFAMVYGLSGARAGSGGALLAVPSRTDGRSTRTPRGDYGEAETMVSGVIAGLGGTLMEQYELKRCSRMSRTGA